MTNYCFSFADVNAKIAELAKETDAQVLRIESRLKDLEAQASMQIPRIEQRLEILEQRPIPGAVELTTQPTPEAAMQRLMDAPMDARGYVDLRGARLASPYSPEGELVEPAAQPAPPVAPAGGVVERVANVLGHYGDASARAVIREVITWLRKKEADYSVIRWLERELDQ